MPLDPIYDSKGTPSRSIPSVQENKTGQRSTPSPSPNPSPEVPVPPCEVIKEFDVGYKEDITPFIEKHCMGCHSNPGPLNWTQYETFFAAREKVFNRLFNTKDMPLPGLPRPTEDEMTIVKRWLELGGPKERGLEVDRSQCAVEPPTPPTSASNPSSSGLWNNSSTNLSTLSSLSNLSNDGNNSL